jgi:hypothetical protein
VEDAVTEVEEPEVYAVASIYITSNELTPTMISEELGLEPTRAQLKREVVLGELRYRDPSNYFILEVKHMGKKTPHSTPAMLLERAIDEVLLKVEHVAGRFHQLRDRVSTSLMCAYGSSEGVGWLSLSEGLIQRMAALSLSLGVYPIPLEQKKG